MKISDIVDRGNDDYVSHSEHIKIVYLLVIYLLTAM